MKPRILMFLAGAACALPIFALADTESDSLRNKLLSCAKIKDDLPLKDCIRDLARNLGPEPLNEQFHRQWGLAKAPEESETSDQGATATRKAPAVEASQEALKLAKIPESDCLRSLCAYRPSYIIFRHSSAPNTWPSSPAPGHTVTAPIANLANEMKFQLSFKSLVTLPDDANRWQVWMAYTQQSQWQLFNPPASRPFRETNYEPEVYVNRVWEKGMPGYDSHLRMVGMGFVHQSNGQSNPLSRSWNRTYLQGAFVGENWTLLLKGWKRWHETANDDDNPGIENFMGRGEATVTWTPSARAFKDQILSLRLRHSLNPAANHGSAQIEWSGLFPGQIGKKGDFRWFIQAFRGYGETMLDYNHLQNTLGFGFGFVNW